MNAQDPLAALQPLRQPELIGWWPPAPGWWALSITALVAMAIIGHLLRKRHTRRAYRRHALQRLQSLHQEYQKNGDASSFLSEVNALLKSVALRTYPRDEVAAVHGDRWRTFLNRNLPPELHLSSAFDAAAYQKTCTGIDPHQVHRAAQYWIRKHKGAP